MVCINQFGNDSFACYNYFNFQTPLIVGFYALSNRVLQMPMALFNSGLSQVFLKNASDNKSNSLVGTSSYENFDKINNGINFPIFVILLIGKTYFHLFLAKIGFSWEISTNLITLGFFCIFSSALSQLVNVYEKQKEALIINIGRLFVKLVLYYYV